MRKSWAACLYAVAIRDDGFDEVVDEAEYPECTERSPIEDARSCGHSFPVRPAIVVGQLGRVCVCVNEKTTGQEVD